MACVAKAPCRRVARTLRTAIPRSSAVADPILSVPRLRPAPRRERPTSPATVGLACHVSTKRAVMRYVGSHLPRGGTQLRYPRPHAPRSALPTSFSWRTSFPRSAIPASFPRSALCITHIFLRPDNKLVPTLRVGMPSSTLRVGISARLTLGSGVMEVFAPRGQGSIARGVRPWNRRRPPEIQPRWGDSRSKPRSRNNFDLRPLRGLPESYRLVPGAKAPGYSPKPLRGIDHHPGTQHKPKRRYG